jgi:hypothetical protein
MNKYTIKLIKNGTVVEEIPSSEIDPAKVAGIGEAAFSDGRADDWQIVDEIGTEIWTRDQYLRRRW